ncbi:hypothetical protein SAMN05421508_1111 [Caenispirillum bisanense]|uniref:Uncharacterized protein n=1 Tax=Caenispirillum bisanense TaxID=414052 RepID=A0A286GWQ8_9PROT|nr:hypothetical protein SAMN05421508_1111 [Caenispirillum bisanense]
MLILTDRNILAKRFASHPDLRPEGLRSGASQDALAFCSIPLGRTAACASLPFVHDVKEQGARSSRIPSPCSAALSEPPGPPGRPLFREARSRCQPLFSLLPQRLGGHLRLAARGRFLLNQPNPVNRFFHRRTAATEATGSGDAIGPHLTSGRGAKPKVPEACSGEPRCKKTDLIERRPALQGKNRRVADHPSAKAVRQYCPCAARRSHRRCAAAESDSGPALRRQ